ncbi:2,5-didehydrogluconate reductase DkgB [Aestuariibacter sp. A3R04]|uniref:2,5-didehydrogluconate reductase DkgB n=1 Tax=Aestuariibacter sp. A3R04 TaxID=2841571 RepID=UPI001C093BB5|nr:2,5-didehydrogluconate reductase DkgB [Aestuariibacter sp. A3R04]MBU3022521.1 2,5-didehydrogluconate reductase DkgB [Aestuariibacter sp. A3R04]
MQSMPQLGVGTFRLEDDVARRTIIDALDVGFRHIDTAQFYGNEEQIGDAIQTSGVARETLFVTTKVWHENLEQGTFIPSVHESLSKLKLAYVDLLLIHWPSPKDNIPMSNYLSLLKQVKQDGLTRHIGVSNFTMAQIDEAESILGKGEILTNQIELHPFMQNRQVVEHCKERGISVTAYMPFAVGKVMKDETLIAIAKQYRATPAQVVLAWLEYKGVHAIPSSTDKSHLKDNISYTSVNLTGEDIVRIDELDNGERIVNPDFAPDWD